MLLQPRDIASAIGDERRRGVGQVIAEWPAHRSCLNILYPQPTMTRPIDRETAAVLEPFLQTLRSDKTLTIPKATLLGALGHFLSLLDGDNLDAYIQDVLNSPSLWDTVTPHDIENAVRAAPASRVAVLKPKIKDTFFKRNRVAKASQEWLGDLVRDLHRAGNSERSLPILVGILNGISDVKDIDWGKPRLELEDTLVIALAERLETENRDEDVLRLFSSVAEDIQPERLRVLDLRVSSPVPAILTSRF